MSFRLKYFKLFPQFPLWLWALFNLLEKKAKKGIFFNAARNISLRAWFERMLFCSLFMSFPSFFFSFLDFYRIFFNFSWIACRRRLTTWCNFGKPSDAKKKSCWQRGDKRCPPWKRKCRRIFLGACQNPRKIYPR